MFKSHVKPNVEARHWAFKTKVVDGLRRQKDPDPDQTKQIRRIDAQGQAGMDLDGTKLRFLRTYSVWPPTLRTESDACAQCLGSDTGH